MASIVGIVVGIACSFPMLYILGASINHPGRIGLGPLVACSLVPFAVLQVFMLCINSIAHDVAVEFGISSTVSGLRGRYCAAFASLAQVEVLWARSRCGGRL